MFYIIRHAEYVTSIAKSADASGFHFGALVFNRNEIISAGWCQEKSHPQQARFMKFAKSYKQTNNWLHAEIHAIIAAKQDIRGCDIAVARWAENRLKPSHPCGACWQAMLVAGIKRVWFWDERQWIYKYIE